MNLTHRQLAERVADRLVRDTQNTNIITDWGEALALFGLLELGRKILGSLDAPYW